MKIVWLTDVQAPYREPMWRELAARSDFAAAFFFREEKVRHWVWRDTGDYRSSLVRSWRLPLPARIARRLDEPAGLIGPVTAWKVVSGRDALIIQVWWQPASIMGVLWARLLRVPYLIYAESTLQSRQFATGPLAWIRSFMFRNAGAVIVPGPAAAEAAIADGTPRERVVESVNSIDLELFQRRVRELRDDTGASTGHRFVYVGQLIERKNIGALIRAFACTDSDCTLDIAGDGPELADLQAVAVQRGVADRVRFHGFLSEDEILRLLATTHTLVLPSTEEVFGFTALEAHMAGLQVIVSARAGIAANLDGREGVWIVEPTEEDIRAALGTSRGAWAGWHEDVELGFASPRRAAEDIIAAVEIARRPSVGVDHVR